MENIFDWQDRGGQENAILTAVHALHRGKLVAFPTETGFCLAGSATSPEAIAQLAGHQSKDYPLSLALPTVDQAGHWVTMSPHTLRLAFRCTPGPVILVLAENEQGLVSQLSTDVLQRLSNNKMIGIYVPLHDALYSTLLALPAPIMVGWPDGPENQGIEELVQKVGEPLGCLIHDAGVERQGLPSLVRFDGDHWEMVHEGAYARQELQRQSGCMILFVCTGNTCRSPMAEVLCRKLLADTLKCAPSDLPDHGFQVTSAGVASFAGDPASPEAVAAAGELGGALKGHQSRPLTPELLVQANHVIAMTNSHLLAIATRYPGYGPAPRLLCPEGADIDDPAGRDEEVYRQCAQQILQHLQRLVPELHQP